MACLALVLTPADRCCPVRHGVGLDSSCMYATAVVNRRRGCRRRLLEVRITASMVDWLPKLTVSRVTVEAGINAPLAVETSDRARPELLILLAPTQPCACGCAARLTSAVRSWKLEASDARVDQCQMAARGLRRMGSRKVSLVNSRRRRGTADQHLFERMFDIAIRGS